MRLKPCLPFLFLLLLAGASRGAEWTHEEHLDPADLRWSEDLDGWRVDFDGAHSCAAAGVADLPGRIVRVTLPAGERLVAWEFETSAPEQVGSRPRWAKAAFVRDADGAARGPLLTEDIGEALRFLGEQSQCGRRTASWLWRPLALAAGELSLHRDLILKLQSTADPEAAIASLRGIEGERGGPFAPSERPSLDGSPVDAVIVTSAAMAPAFQVLADWHVKRGTRCVIMDLDWIAAHYPPGRDRGENIRFFLQDAYRLWGLKAVILGGDTDVIPTRYALTRADSPEGETIPTDLYYSCLDGNWNANMNEYWAEAPYLGLLGDDTDLSPELWLGRIPVSSPQEAASLVSKLINYRETELTGFQNHIIFFAEILFPPDWSPGEEYWKDGAEYAVGVLDSLLNPQMQPTALFENWEDPIYVNVQPKLLTQTAAYDSMNTGHFAFVDQNGHGFRYNMSVGNGSLLIGHALSLTNDSPFHLALNNCASTAFDFDCLAENFLRNPHGGAVAVFGTTRSSFPSASYPYQVAYYRSLLRNGETRPGAAMQAMREDRMALALAEGYVRWTYFIFTFLGDPLLDLWAGDIRHYEVSAPVRTRVGAGQLNFWVRDRGEPVQGAHLTLFKEGEVWAAGVSDEAGFCALAANPQSVGSLTLRVWGPNAAMQDIAIPVEETERSMLRVSAFALDDDPAYASQNNGDGVFDAAEQVHLVLTLANSGAAEAAQVAVDLSQLSITLQVMAGHEDFGSVAPGGSVEGEGDLVLRGLASAPDGSLARLAVTIESSADQVSDTLELKLHAPNPVLAEWSFNDDPPHGNGNGIFEESEPLRAIPRYVNLGSGITGPLTASLVSLDNDLSIIEGDVSLPSLAQMESGLPDPGFLIAMADPSQVYFAEVTLNDAVGRHWTKIMDLEAPDPPSDLISDASLGADRIALSWHHSQSPDVYGYHVYVAQGSPSGYTRYTLLPVQHEAIVVADLEENRLTYLYVTAVDESGMESQPSAVNATSTNPPQLSGFPQEIQAESSVSPAVGNIAGDSHLELVTAADYVYAWHHDGVEVRDGDNSSATSGVLCQSAAQIAGPVTLLPLLNNGYLQIVVATIGDNPDGPRGIVVLDGDGQVLPGWPRTTSEWIWANVVGADLDGDQDLEIVAVDLTGKVYAFHHDGSPVIPGSGGVLRADVGAWTIGSPAVADMDQDGDDEIVLLGRSELLYVLQEDGSNMAGFPVNLDPTHHSEYYNNSPTVVANLDGSLDGSLEILVQSEADSLFAFRSDGSRFPGYPRRLVTNDSDVGPGPIPLDVDGDGDMELFIVETFGAGNSRLHLQNYDGTERPGWPVNLPANTQSSPVAGDVDGDGQMEFILGTEQGIIYGFNEDGSTQAGFPIGVGGEIRGTPALCDLDGDGDVELAASTNNRRVLVWSFSGSYSQEALPWPTISGNYRRTGLAGDWFGDLAAGESAPGDAEVSPGGGSFLGAHPNPFNPSTTLVFETSRPGLMRLEIFSPAGRLLRRLYSGSLPAGRHEQVWDGRDDAGRPLASGVYLLRLEHADRSELARLVLLK